jgi:hypothetical protein
MEDVQKQMDDVMVVVVSLLALSMAVMSRVRVELVGQGRN